MDYSEEYLQHEVSFKESKLTHHFKITFPPGHKISPLFHECLSQQVLCNVLKCAKCTNKLDTSTTF